MKQAGQKGIPTDRRNRSMLAFLADQSTARKVETRVRHACKYYNAVRPHFQTAESGGGSTGGGGTDG